MVFAAQQGCSTVRLSGAVVRFDEQNCVVLECKKCRIVRLSNANTGTIQKKIEQSPKLKPFFMFFSIIYLNIHFGHTIFNIELLYDFLGARIISHKCTETGFVWLGWYSGQCLLNFLLLFSFIFLVFKT